MSIFVPCSRCSGKGEIPAFGHVAGGVCFLCGGAKGKTYSDAAAARRARARAKRDAEKVAVREASEARAENRRVAALIERYRDDPRLGPKTRRRYGIEYNGWQHAGAEIAKELRRIDTEP